PLIALSAISNEATATVAHVLSALKKPSNVRSEGGRLLPSRMLSMISFKGHGRSRSVTATINVQMIASTKFHFSALRLRMMMLRNLVFTNPSIEHGFSDSQELRQFLQNERADTRHGAEGAFVQQGRSHVPAQRFECFESIEWSIACEHRAG